ncbi:hypothetical protein N7474_007063 [Penicillium riverlandense]|uniref:uncharacterized protein n=1 Tax=Penicillium riverlandense TaxID=1903569 RepID=UPI0025467042|nr:uncharacterized protein N7474_007063 [Penicillium riverlandense]KAJ5815286.1 hypothetical protein N7474_007063 [Penicillium riverlandense]
MAGVEQKSFLGSLSPWGTPRASTPQSGHQHGQEVLQRSQGEDHTVTHRHKLSARLYPRDCPALKVRWFYAVDSPKRKPALLGEKKPDQKALPLPKKFIPFSMKDSQSIEATFQRLADIEDTREGSDTPGSNEPEVSTKVPVNEDFLFDVDVERRELAPAYWVGPVYEVRRGTWFFQDGSTLKPCEENLATQLEEGYLKVRPWRPDTTQPSLERPAPKSNEHDRSGGTVDHGTAQPTSTGAAAPSQGTAGTGPSVPPIERQQYRLFGAYMNRIVAYQDSSTAWVINDDFMSRVSTTVYQKLGGIPGTKVIRGDQELKRSKEPVESKNPESKNIEKASAPSAPEPSSAQSQQLEAPTSLKAPRTEKSEGDENNIQNPRSTLERQMSSLAGEPQNPAELEEQARMQEEQEMEDSREVDGEDREREVDHLILVTHGIGQRLGLRLESINFIHDVNVLRKTLKGVYKASPDLQALNAAFPDSNRNCRVQVLPVCWRHLLDFPYRGVRQNRKELDLADADALEDDTYPGLSDITLESVPAVRNLISDLAMDVLLYQSRYCEHISNIVKQECNRILDLYRQRNPSFKGSVSLCGHSLGSAILFDILCHQPDHLHPSHEKGNASIHSDGGSPALDFECEEFFCLGSPIALFQMLKGKTIAGYAPPGKRSRNSTLDVDINPESLGAASKRDSHISSAARMGDNSAIFSSPRCRDLYNIFHPSDPVSYRLEPLISPAMAALKPQPLPSVKKSLWTASGQSLSVLGSRMGQSMGSLWTNFTTGVASSLLNRSLGLPADEAHAGKLAGHPTLIESDLETLYDGFQKTRHNQKKTDPGDADTDLEAEDQERKLRLEDAKVRALNANGRVDYSVQEGAFDISLIASIASHLTYWGDEDVNHFMLSQMLSRRSRHRRPVP